MKKILFIFTVLFFLVVIYSYKTNIDKPHYLKMDSFNGGVNKKIYIIQNLHCHRQTQILIKRMIHTLKDKYKGSLKVIGQEGSFSKLSIPKLDAKIVKRLLHAGYITGAELYNIDKRDIDIFGIENKELYMENFTSLYKSLDYSMQTEQTIKKFKKILANAKRVLYTKSLNKFIKKSKKYKKNNCSLREYTKFVVDTAIKLKINNLGEHVALMYKIGILKDYFLFSNELKNLELQIKYRLVDTDLALDIIYLDMYFDLFERLLQGKITAQELNIYKQNRGDFYEKLDTIMNIFNDQILEDKHKFNIKLAEQNMLDFYIKAEKRNEFLVNNMLKNIDKTDSKISVMLIGGFHTRGITEILRSRGISYEVLCPITNNNYDRSQYINRINEQARLLDIKLAKLGPHIKASVQTLHKLEFISLFDSTFKLEVFEDMEYKIYKKDLTGKIKGFLKKVDNIFDKYGSFILSDTFLNIIDEIIFIKVNDKIRSLIKKDDKRFKNKKESDYLDEFNKKLILLDIDSSFYEHSIYLKDIDKYELLEDFEMIVTRKVTDTYLKWLKLKTNFKDEFDQAEYLFNTGRFVVFRLDDRLYSVDLETGERGSIDFEKNKILKIKYFAARDKNIILILSDNCVYEYNLNSENIRVFCEGIGFSFIDIEPTIKSNELIISMEEDGVVHFLDSKYLCTPIRKKVEHIKYHEKHDLVEIMLKQKMNKIYLFSLKDWRSAFSVSHTDDIFGTECIKFGSEYCFLSWDDSGEIYFTNIVTKEKKKYSMNIKAKFDIDNLLYINKKQTIVVWYRTEQGLSFKVKKVTSYDKEITGCLDADDMKYIEEIDKFITWNIDGEVFLYDIEQRKEFEFKSRINRIKTIEFMKDNSELLIIGHNNVIELWKLDITVREVIFTCKKDKRLINSYELMNSKTLTFKKRGWLSGLLDTVFCRNYRLKVVVPFDLKFVYTLEEKFEDANYSFDTRQELSVFVKDLKSLAKKMGKALDEVISLDKFVKLRYRIFRERFLVPRIERGLSGKSAKGKGIKGKYIIELPRGLKLDVLFINSGLLKFSKLKKGVLPNVIIQALDNLELGGYEKELLTKRALFYLKNLIIPFKLYPPHSLLVFDNLLKYQKNLIIAA